MVKRIAKAAVKKTVRKKVSPRTALGGEQQQASLCETAEPDDRARVCSDVEEEIRSAQSSSRKAGERGPSENAPDQLDTCLPTGFLQDPATIDADLDIAAQIVKAIRRWGNLSEKFKEQIVTRLMNIVSKEEISVATKDGSRDDEVIADKNAIAAARVLAMLEAQNQKDEHHRDGIVGPRSKSKAGDSAVRNNVQININQPPTVQDIIQEAIRSGACEQLLDLENRLRTTEANPVSGDVRHECQPGTLGCGEPPALDRSSYHANSQGADISADPDYRSTTQTREI